MKNRLFLDHKLNITFEECLAMTTEQFRAWCIDIRKLVVDLWDNHDQPPLPGVDKADMIADFQALAEYPLHKLWANNQHVAGEKVIRNTAYLGNSVNEFFPTMLKTRINYSKDVEKGRSIYDFFARDDLLERFIKYATRHFKRDSFYAYSQVVKVDDREWFGRLPVTDNAVEWIMQFEKSYRAQGIYDYWLESKDPDASRTGYDEKQRSIHYLSTRAESFRVPGIRIPLHTLTNLMPAKADHIQIRVYEKGQKLFPIGLKFWRVSFCQHAVNFPPLTARLIYETYLPTNKERAYVWDCSSGWGGRLLGALSVKRPRRITYLGNDPNTDHTTGEGRTKYHDIYDFYIKNLRRGGIFSDPHHGFEFWQLGSEEMGDDPDFQKYRGRIDMVFTSPPYFSKEAYSEDETQSYKRFTTFEDWTEGFLAPTLMTAAVWLKPGGYLCWNINDTVFDGEMFNLEGASRSLMKMYGLKYVTTHKMILGQMPGANRVDPVTGLPSAKNFAKVNGTWYKYEPIYVYQK